MKLQQWVRKPIPLAAVQVTIDNMPEVAIWCKSPIETDEKHKHHIAVRFKNPRAERRLRAYPGDYVLQIGDGFKIYTAKAFLEGFEPAPVVQYDVEPEDWLMKTRETTKAVEASKFHNYIRGT